MSKQVAVEQSCAACGVQWRDRNKDVFSTGAKTTPFVSQFDLLSHHGKKKFKLTFCDKHLKNLRHVTKYMNGSGILKIRNVITNKWRNASALGDVV